ncbi:MAG: hypothetical protein PV340_03120 [Wolbachia sp.]|nr:hypothetical protein [Wolbachia sp.]MDD9336658.1 hypothetical protein [Wolbachia sp.]
MQTNYYLTAKNLPEYQKLLIGLSGLGKRAKSVMLKKAMWTIENPCQA